MVLHIHGFEAEILSASQKKATFTRGTLFQVMVVHTTKDTEGIPAPSISIFPYSKNNSLFRLSSEQMEELYRGDLSCEDYLTKNSYNQSNAVIDIFLGFKRKMSLFNKEDTLFEELMRPSFGQYYVFRLGL